MKKLIMVFLAVFTLQITAQEKREGDRSEMMKQKLEKMSAMSAEDMAQLQTKKMTLDLDLNDSQIKQIHQINLENAKAKKVAMEKRIKAMESGEFKKPSQEERLKLANERLDTKIAQKRKIKTILNTEQYTKWEKTNKRRSMHGKKRAMKKKGMRKKGEKGERRGERREHRESKDRD